MSKSSCDSNQKMNARDGLVDFAIPSAHNQESKGVPPVPFSHHPFQSLFTMYANQSFIKKGETNMSGESPVGRYTTRGDGIANPQLLESFPTTFGVSASARTPSQVTGLQRKNVQIGTDQKEIGDRLERTEQ
jgi:hypothetical protein